MKLQAKARLLATSPLSSYRTPVSSQVTLVLNKGESVDFRSGHDYFEWRSANADPNLLIMVSYPVGHYDVLMFADRIGVARCYQTLPQEPLPTGPLFRQTVGTRRTQIGIALDALKRARHPLLNKVTHDAQAELDFFEKHLPTLKIPEDPVGNMFRRRIESRRSQQWFHKLSAEEQDEYCTKFPGTRFRHTRRLVVPD